MKKSLLSLLLIVIISLIYITPSITSQGDIDIPGLSGPLDPDKTEEFVENFTDAETSTEYLKKEWEKILKKDARFNKTMQTYEKVSNYTDPFFQYTIGMKPHLSWLFVLTFAIWLTFVIFIFRVLSAFSESSKITLIVIAAMVTVLLSLEFLSAKVFALILITILLSIILTQFEFNLGGSILFSFLLAFIITGFTTEAQISGVLFGFKPIQLFGAPKLLALLVIAAISPLKIWWVQLIAVGVVIAGIIAANVFSEKFKEFIDYLKQKWNDKLNELERQESDARTKEILKVGKTLEGIGR